MEREEVGASRDGEGMGGEARGRGHGGTGRGRVERQEVPVLRTHEPPRLPAQQGTLREVADTGLGEVCQGEPPTPLTALPSRDLVVFSDPGAPRARGTAEARNGDSEGVRFSGALSLVSSDRLPRTGQPDVTGGGERERAKLTLTGGSCW